MLTGWKHYPSSFARTVRKDRIRFAGRSWHPDKPTNGRFDGRRYRFFTYPAYGSGRPAIEDFLAFGSSEETHRRLWALPEDATEEQREACFDNEDEHLMADASTPLRWYLDGTGGQ